MKSKVFLAWKNEKIKPNAEEDWVLMTGSEFVEFINGEGMHRKNNFVTLNGDTSYDEIIIECTPQKARKWEADRQKRLYQLKKLKTDGYAKYETQQKMVIDEFDDPETVFFKKYLKEALYEGIRQLTSIEQELIVYLFLADIPYTLSEYAAKKDLSPAAIHKRKTKALEKLRVYLKKNGIFG